MKKLYTVIALSLALGLPASARKQATDIALPAALGTAVEVENTITLKAKAPAKAPSIHQITGSYAWNYYGFITGEQGDRVADATIELKDDALAISLKKGKNVFTIAADYDPETAKITFANRQLLGQDKDGDIYFYLKAINSDGYLLNGAASAETSYGIYKDGSIQFDPAFAWAVGTPENEDAGYYILAALNQFTPPAAEDENWANFSNATFTDGWITPGIENGKYNPADYPIVCPVQQNKKDAAHFRLVNPYKGSGSPFASTAKDGFIEFSIADPEFVAVLPGVYSGMDNGANNLMHLFNLEGYFTAAGFPKDEIIAQLGDKVKAWSTYSNGKATVYNCRFCYASDPEKYYVWQNADERMVATITFDKLPDLGGIDGVTVTDNDEAVEYYNLQGLKVENPAAGIFIRRQGAKATKVFVQ